MIKAAKMKTVIKKILRVQLTRSVTTLNHKNDSAVYTRSQVFHFHREARIYLTIKTRLVQLIQV